MGRMTTFWIILVVVLVIYWFLLSLKYKNKEDVPPLILDSALDYLKVNPTLLGYRHTLVYEDVIELFQHLDQRLKALEEKENVK